MAYVVATAAGVSIPSQEFVLVHLVRTQNLRNSQESSCFHSFAGIRLSPSHPLKIATLPRIYTPILVQSPLSSFAFRSQHEAQPPKSLKNNSFYNGLISKTT